MAVDDRSEAPLRQAPEDFMRLFLAHQRRLYQYILALVYHPQDAEDLLQETSQTLWEKFAEYTPESHFFAWSSQIAFFKVQNFRRLRRHRQQVLDPDVLELVAAEAQAEEELLSLHQQALLHCLDKLAPADRQLISRRYAAGGSRQRLAEELGRPANSISKSLGRIRLALLRCVQQQLAKFDAPPYPGK
jgi:RNA polymerase sigma-70 factor (ECF subfamily)